MPDLLDLYTLMSFLVCCFFNDTATTEIYTLSLHDALPIWHAPRRPRGAPGARSTRAPPPRPDRKSTRLNSSHVAISYAVFCLKKNNTAECHADYFDFERIEAVNPAIEACY